MSITAQCILNLNVFILFFRYDTNLARKQFEFYLEKFDFRILNPTALLNQIAFSLFYCQFQRDLVYFY